MDSVQGLNKDTTGGADGSDQDDNEQEILGKMQQSVQIPRFIRVNNRTSGAFVKLKGKPCQISA